MGNKMKITESKLRQIIREELIREYGLNPYADFTEREKSLAKAIDKRLNPGLIGMTNWRVEPVPIKLSDYPNDGSRGPLPRAGDLGYVVKKKNPTGGLDGDYYPAVARGSTRAKALENALDWLKRQR